MAGQRLTRDLQHSMLGGVCAGFAQRYDFDVTLVRVVTVLLAVATGGIAIPVYVAAWIVMPREDAAAAAPRPAGTTPETLSRELRDVSDRLAEAARVLADKTREAAEEISEIARRGSATTSAPAPAPEAPAAPAPEATATNAVPPVPPVTPASEQSPAPPTPPAP
ncbi:MAG: PspC domain-containing protein [Dehalococcoidia bacterium]